MLRFLRIGKIFKIYISENKWNLETFGPIEELGASAKDELTN
jgi:hypothetical protein